MPPAACGHAHASTCSIRYDILKSSSPCGRAQNISEPIARQLHASPCSCHVSAGSSEAMDEAMEEHIKSRDERSPPLVADIVRPKCVQMECLTNYQLCIFAWTEERGLTAVLQDGTHPLGHRDTHPLRIQDTLMATQRDHFLF